MASSDLKSDLIRSLSSRLENILPNRSGYNIAEVELNAQFILTTNLFLANSKPSAENGQLDFMPDIIEHFTAILEKLNIDPNTRKVRDRDEKSLTSTVVVMKLFSTIIRFSWDKNASIGKNSNITANEGVNFNFDLGYHSENYMIYSFQPTELLNTDIHHTLEVLFCLLSDEVNREALGNIRRVRPDKFKPIDYSLTSDTSLTHDEIRNYVREIDENILLVLRYLAAANPNDYYSFLNRKLFAWAERGEYIPNAALHKYSCLLKFLYYTKDVADQYARQVYSMMPYVRSNSWKQVCLYFDSHNIKYQCLHRPNFYAEQVIPGQPSEQNFKTLFDYVSTAFEDQELVGIAPSLHSWFVMLCPSDFDELLQKPNKLKQAFNKRLKFLTSILKDASSGANLECFESLINIFSLGARIPGLKGDVREFSVKYIDETFENLKKMGPNCLHESSKAQYRQLSIDLYVAAIAINPDKYIPILVNYFTAALPKSEDGCKDLCICPEIEICMCVIKGLAHVETYREPLQTVMERLRDPLKSLLFTTYRKLSLFDSNRPESSSSSSLLSQPSDKLPEADKSMVNSNPLLSSLKKSNLDYGLGSVQDKSASTYSETAVDSGSNRSVSQTNFETAYNSKCIGQCERIMSQLFEIFAASPEAYIGYLSEKVTRPEGGDQKALLKDLISFAHEMALPIKQAIHFKSVNGNSDLFESACTLAMTMVRSKSHTLRDTEVKECLSFLFSNLVIKAIAEACTVFSLTDPNFKLCFIFLNKFLQERDISYKNVTHNKLLQHECSHSACHTVCEAVEIILLLALCTHDVQFFGMAKLTMRWHILEIENGGHPYNCFDNHLAHVFKRILDDDSVFTGFVSLHKKFRNILMEAPPTSSLYHVWLLIYQRWLDIVDSSSTLTDASLVFRHYTGFLVSTSGCFLNKDFLENDPKEKEKALALISAFFDRAISLLKLNELVVRVVIKDALSNESHPAVFHLVCTKLMNAAIYYVDQGVITSEGVLFMEQMMAIITAMTAIKNDGSFVLVSLLPGVCEFLHKFTGMVTNPIDLVKLKLRFCKVCSAIEMDRERNGIAGAYKLRSQYAKISLEWLEQAVFFDGSTEEADTDDSVLTTPSTNNNQSKSSELEFLYIELASECSKCLEMQLQDSLFEVPEGVSEKNLKQSKDLVFSNHFSLFFKILQKYTSPNPSPTMMRSKYKIQGITDNVLKSISNILQSDTEHGMHFVLPLGYHQNKKIRSIFLNIFGDMLSTKKLKSAKEEFPDELVFEMADIYEVYGAAAEVASPAEHNLLATSLHGLFGYTKKLDKLFVTLLTDEISSVARSTDIFRRNSTLTRLMSIFAKEDGLPYLTVVLKPVIEEIMENSVVFEVEKSHELADVDLFVQYLAKIVDRIVSSSKWFPDSFQFICSEIYNAVGAKFEDAALIAVGSFVFLRFFCPAIVSPESFFDLSTTNVKVKRSLIQLVKVIQYMANGTLSSLKWEGLLQRSERLGELNKKIFLFLEDMSTTPIHGYPFHSLTVKPYTGLRYIHKFFYTYFVYIKHQLTLGDPLVNAGNLHERVLLWRRLDKIMKELGRPRPSISLQGTTSYKAVDPSANLGNSQYAEFMAKMSVRNMELAIDSQVIHSAVFPDGTPVVVVNFRHIKDIGYDMSTFVYLILEAASQVWENKFYIVNDFTQFFYMGIIGKNYVSLMRNYAPSIFFKNCAKIYYFNLPRYKHVSIIEDMVALRVNVNPLAKAYFYSQTDKSDIVNSLCLSESTTSIDKDVRVIFNDCKVYESATQQFVPATLKLGRKWMQICFDRTEFKPLFAQTESITPVEVHQLADITRCEISNNFDSPNEFTMSLNRYNYEVIISSTQRLAILRFLYFAMLRTSREISGQKKDEDDLRELHWFGKLYNIVFHALLERDTEVRSSASYLFSSMSAYYDVDFGVSPSHASSIAFPTDTTDFVVSVSTYLAKHRPENTYRFIKAFFNNFERLPEEHHVSAIMYISPWIDNVGSQIFMELENGAERVAEIARQFCRITSQTMNMLPFLNNYVWKKLFADLRLTSVLLDEIIAFAIDNKSDESEWELIISVLSPSVELCGELMSRLVSCIHKTKSDDSDIASQSKLLEITVLIKICAAMFFNSYVFGSLYLLHVFFFCSLFIDSPKLEFGPDLQKLTINTVQSFVHKPDLSEKQRELIEGSIEYFTSQRARMLFGFSSGDRSKGSDATHLFNRATAFDLLCDQLKSFMLLVGTSDDRIRWTARWSSLAMEMAFSAGSLFQRRAITLVGTLARSGISDSAGGRMMKMLVDNKYHEPNTYVHSGICYARLEEGLAPDSKYLPILIWTIVCHSLLSFPPLYQTAICCTTSMLTKMEHREDFMTPIMDTRYLLEPLLTEFEGEVDHKINEKNFQLHIMIFICLGLTTSQFRHTSVHCLKNLLIHKLLLTDGLAKKAYKNEYLLIAFLSMSDSAYNDFLKENFAEEEELQCVSKHSLPKAVIDHMENISGETKIALILAAYIFDSDSDSNFKLKFIRLYNHLFATLRDFALVIFHLVKRGLESNMVSSTSIDLITSISNIMVDVIQDKEYAESKSEAELNNILEEYDFQRVRKVKEFKNQVSDNVCDMKSMKMVQQLMHRSISSVVEGERLEKS